MSKEALLRLEAARMRLFEAVPCYLCAERAGDHSTEQLAEHLLVGRMADHWGGRGCPREIWTITSYRFGRAGSRYCVWSPGSTAHLAEDSGYPFTKVVPPGRYLVRCLDDAPDAWWYVEADGSFRTVAGEGKL